MALIIFSTLGAFMSGLLMGGDDSSDAALQSRLRRGETYSTAAELATRGGPTTKERQKMVLSKYPAVDVIDDLSVKRRSIARPSSNVRRTTQERQALSLPESRHDTTPIAVNGSDPVVARAVLGEEFSLCSAFAAGVADRVCVLSSGGAPHACLWQPTAALASAGAGDDSCVAQGTSAPPCADGRRLCRVDRFAAAAPAAASSGGGGGGGGGGVRPGPAIALLRDYVQPAAFLVINLPSSTARLARMRAQFEGMRLPPL
jgi:hypothetical protein